jgi:predicted ATPase with chaperone activity
VNPTGEVAAHPGEASLAHRGVLLDDMPESGPRILEDLRLRLGAELT